LVESVSLFKFQLLSVLCQHLSFEILRSEPVIFYRCITEPSSTLIRLTPRLRRLCAACLRCRPACAAHMGTRGSSVTTLARTPRPRAHAGRARARPCLACACCCAMPVAQPPVHVARRCTGGVCAQPDHACAWAHRQVDNARAPPCAEMDVLCFEPAPACVFCYKLCSMLSLLSHLCIFVEFAMVPSKNLGCYVVHIAWCYGG
jgi:hypothetical protein